MSGEPAPGMALVRMQTGPLHEAPSTCPSGRGWEEVCGQQGQLRF